MIKEKKAIILENKMPIENLDIGFIHHLNEE